MQILTTVVVRRAVLQPEATGSVGGHEVTLTLEEFRLLRHRGCEYCGADLPRCGYGIDRANNALGYTLKNSVACCTECNQMKGKHMTHAEMKAAMDIRIPIERKMFINQLPL